MKFGVAIAPYNLEELAVSARLAEDMGFDYIGIPDSQSLWRELYVSLSVVANATRRVRIGPTVTNALTRHPAVTAPLPSPRSTSFLMGGPSWASAAGTVPS